MPAISVRLPDELSQRLQKLAARTGRTKTYYILEAVQDHLEEIEDVYLAEQRLSELRSGRSQALSLEEVERKLGLGD